MIDAMILKTTVRSVDGVDVFRSHPTLNLIHRLKEDLRSTPLLSLLRVTRHVPFHN